jgi:hypothetical protein
MEEYGKLMAGTELPQKSVEDRRWRFLSVLVEEYSNSYEKHVR